MSGSPFRLEQKNTSEARLWTGDDSHYLAVNLQPFMPALDVHLKVLANNCVMTGRQVEEYLRKLPSLALDEKKNYCEVGAGLSGLMHTLAMMQLDSGKRPVVIDPLQYDLAQDMLMDALRRAQAGDSPFAEKLSRIAELLQNCSTIRDSTRVQLFNCTLSEALRKEPALLGNFDVVIDLYGALEYMHIEDPNLHNNDLKGIQKVSERIRDMEKQLLRPDGILLSNN